MLFFFIMCLIIKYLLFFFNYFVPCSGKAAVNKKDLVMAMFGVDALVEEVDKEAVSLQCGRACGARSGITQKGNLTPTLGFRE